MTWSIPRLYDEDASFTPLGICGHSAVLVENKLFIMFGGTTDGSTMYLTNRTWVLDVDCWAWVSSISAVSPQETSYISLTGDDNANSAEIIAGAVIGAVAGAAIIACSVFLYIRRKRQNLQKSTEEHIEINREALLAEDDCPAPNDKNAVGCSIDNNRQSTAVGSRE